MYLFLPIHGHEVKRSVRGEQTVEKRKKGKEIEHCHCNFEFFRLFLFFHACSVFGTSITVVVFGCRWSCGAKREREKEWRDIECYIWRETGMERGKMCSDINPWLLSSLLSVSSSFSFFTFRILTTIPPKAHIWVKQLHSFFPSNLMSLCSLFLRHIVRRSRNGDGIV